MINKNIFVLIITGYIMYESLPWKNLKRWASFVFDVPHILNSTGQESSVSQ